MPRLKVSEEPIAVCEEQLVSLRPLAEFFHANDWLS